MPKWGLTKEQIEAQPWDLPESLLRAEKTVTNSIQGDVYVTRLERLFIDGPPMQRLRRVKQLGNTHLVYPDGTHTRFSHSLGALRTVQDLLDYIFDQENRPKPQDDLFQEWKVSFKATPDKYVRRVAEVIVAARLGALLHDMCHVPFGHTIEDDLAVLEKHDANETRFEELWRQFPDEVRDAVTPALKHELRLLILSKLDRKKESPSRYPFVEDLVGNTICADLLDYLRRDHQNLGLPLALGHRFLEGLYVTPSNHPHHKQHVAIEILRDGHERSDVITELLKALRYRYEESERALAHHAKLAPDAMIGKLLAMWRDALFVEIVQQTAEDVGAIPEQAHKDVDILRSWIEGLDSTERMTILTHLNPETASPPSAETTIAAIEAEVINRLEEAFLLHGDEGLLERIATESAAIQGDSRRAAMASLAFGVLNRTLYKRIARSLPEDRHLAQSIFDQYGAADDRRRLELECAEFAGLNERWHLVLWIPSPDMRLKLAKVLVGGGDLVTTLDEYSERVRDIYESHERLWSVGVYVHPDVTTYSLQQEIILAWLRERLGLRGWATQTPTESVDEIAVRHFVQQHDDVTERTRQRLLAGVSGLAPGEPKTLASINEHLSLLITALKETNDDAGSSDS